MTRSRHKGKLLEPAASRKKKVPCSTISKNSSRENWVCFSWTNNQVYLWQDLHKHIQSLKQSHLEAGGRAFRIPIILTLWSLAEFVSEKNWGFGVFGNEKLHGYVRIEALANGTHDSALAVSTKIAVKGSFGLRTITFLICLGQKTPRDKHWTFSPRSEGEAWQVVEGEDGQEGLGRRSIPEL